jgi:hypothetical protein
MDDLFTLTLFVLVYFIGFYAGQTYALAKVRRLCDQLEADGRGKTLESGETSR